MNTAPVEVYNPVCYVYFFPATTIEENSPQTLRPIYGAGGWGNFRYEDERKSKELEMDNDVIYVTTQVTINGIGTNLFTIRLVNKEDKNGLTWDKKINSRDLVLITMKRPGIDSDSRPVMFGVVRSVNKVVSISSGPDGKNSKVERYIEVTGNDLSALIADHNIFFNPNYLGAIDTIRNILGGSTPGSVHYGLWFADLINSDDESKRIEGLIKQPHEFVQDYLENYCLPDYQYTVVPYFQQPLSNLLHFNSESNSFALNGEKLNVYGLNFMTFTGSGASFINQVLQKPFNEVIIDYGSNPLPDNASCYLTVRPAPFYYYFTNEQVADTNSLTPLPDNAGNLSSYLISHTITDLDVQKENIMVSDEGAFNLFLVDKASPGAWALDPTLHTKPALDLNSIRRYGTRPTIMSFDYFPAPAGGNEEELQESVDQVTNYANGLSEVLRQWFIKQPKYMQGEITIKGQASIHVGQRLVYSSKERNQVLEFYIHGVRQTFINFGNFLTTLSVSRGRVLSEAT